MKKLISILMVLLILLLSGCTSTESPATDFTGFNDITYGGILETQCTLGEYNLYFKTYEEQLPKEFVTFTKLSKLGTFFYFAPYPHSFPNEYVYGFRDSHGNELSLYITHLSTKYSGFSSEEHHKDKVPKDMVNMRVLTNSQRKTFIERGELTYYYNTKGKLTHIIWNNNGVQYSLRGYTYSYNNPIFNGLVSMNENEFNAAFEELKQALTAK